MSGLIAVVVAREGVLPSGADETVAECGGEVLLCAVASGISASGTPGSGSATPEELAENLAEGLPGVRRVWVLTAPSYAPGALAVQIAASGLIDDRSVVLPASPDGRDLAPRLARALRRPLYAGAVQVSSQVAGQVASQVAAQSTVHLARGGGRQIETVQPTETFVATLVPGVRGVSKAGAAGTSRLPEVTVVDVPVPDATEWAASPRDVRVIETLPPDAATMDLAEAKRILCGGAGLDDAARFEQLGHLAASIGASVGATRVITDRGWIGHDRQIGTTGAVVDPDLYLAFGISGAVQHTSGLGDPDHIVSVNTDPHCPMMQMADLAIVSDANAVLDALVRRLADGPEGRGAPQAGAA